MIVVVVEPGRLKESKAITMGTPAHTRLIGCWAGPTDRRMRIPSYQTSYQDNEVHLNGSAPRPLRCHDVEK